MAAASIEPEVIPSILWPGLHLVNFKGLLGGGWVVVWAKGADGWLGPDALPSGDRQGHNAAMVGWACVRAKGRRRPDREAAA